MSRAPSRLGLLLTNGSSPDVTQAAPVYRPVASVSQICVQEPDLESPPYKQYSSNSMVNIEGDKLDDSHRDEEVDNRRPIVHYPSEIDVRAVDRKVNTDEESTEKSIAVVGTDDEDFEENYDWSTDEDLVDEEAKFEHKLEGENPRKVWGPKRVATFFLSTLIGSTLLAGVIVSIPIVLHFYYLAPNDTEQRQYITDNVSAWLYWTAANLLLSWYLAMIVDIIPIICNLAIALVWGEINEGVRSRVELYSAAKDKIKPVLYGASGWVSWIIVFDGIYNLYDHHNELNSRASYTPRTYQAIQFLFFFTLVLSVEKILSHIIAFAFHRKAFNDRLETLKHGLNVIDHLRGYRPKRHFPKPSNHRAVFSLGGLVTGTPGFEKQRFLHHSSKNRPVAPGVLSDDEGHAGDTEEGLRRSSQHSRKGKQRRGWVLSSAFTGRENTNASGIGADAASVDQPYGLRNPHTYPPATPSPNEGNGHDSGRVTPPTRRSNEDDATVIVQAAKALRTAVLHDARNIKGKGDGASGLGWSVNSAHEAKRLARSIYMAFKADHRRRYLIPSDFYPAYMMHEDAEDAFKVFDKDNNGDISRAEIKTKILKVYKERRALTRSLRDVSNALKTLDGIMIFFAMVILFFVSLSVFNIAIGSSLTSFYTIGIAASFIFKNSASSAFDAVMFIFVTHPFDTGDRVFVDDENLVVKKMGLFATTFMRADGTETYYFNSQLFTKFITNVQRSGKMFENLTVQVAWRTPLEKLDRLEKCMNEWLATEENRWFEPHTAVTLQTIEYQRCLEFTMAIGHNGTWQDWGLRNVRKTAFLTAVHFYCRQLGITFFNTPQPILVAENEEHPSKVGLHISSSHVTAANSPALGPPASPDRLSTPTSHNDALDGDEQTEEVVKPVLGFVPPPDTKSSLTRARKSKLRKGNIRGIADGAGDG